MPRKSDLPDRKYEGINALATPGQRIKFLRLGHGLSQEALAKKCFATQPAVSQWENDVWVPSLRSQHLLAEALGISHHFLFGEVAA